MQDFPNWKTKESREHTFFTNLAQIFAVAFATMLDFDI